jgi:peptide/nickel transport system permease protein
VRVSLPSLLARRFVAVAATVVIAPTVATTVFSWLSGRLGDESAFRYAWDYLVQTFWHLDLGISSTYDMPVAAVIRETLPSDLAMVAGGVATGFALGLAGGLLCAIRPGSLLARAAHGLVLFVLSSPPYWLGFMMLIFFAPGTGYVLQIPFVSGLGEYVPLTREPLRWLQSLWVPWLLVGLPLAAAVLRMTEVSIRDALGEDYLRTARAKGLSDARVIRRHAFPMAVAPVAALTGVNMAIVITNVALMESAFNIPGIYREIRQIASFDDWPLLQGMIIETTAIIVLANMVADGVQARLDPGVR